MNNCQCSSYTSIKRMYTDEQINPVVFVCGRYFIFMLDPDKYQLDTEMEPII